MNDFHEWSFDEIDKHQQTIHIDVFEDFKPELSTENSSHELAGQNPVDARHDPKLPVTVTITLPNKNKPLSKRDSEFWLGGLKNQIKSHITDNGSGYTVTKELNSLKPKDLDGIKLDFLLIEDENTVGLTGDPGPGIHYPGDTKDEEGWNSFWFSFNRSQKKNSMGTRGIGRLACISASELQSFIAVTKREEDKKCFAQGMSFMPTKLYKDFGYFCSSNEKRGKTAFQLDDDKYSQLKSRLKSDFGVSREKCGTSLIIFQPRGIDQDKLIRTLILHWFIRILKDDLIIKIKQHKDDQNPIVIDSNNIKSSQTSENENVEIMLNRIEGGWKKDKGPFPINKKSIVTSGAATKTDIDRIINDWVLGADLILNDDQETAIKINPINFNKEILIRDLPNLVQSVVPEIRELLKENEPVLIKVPVTIHSNKNQKFNSELNISVIKSINGFSGSYFARDGLCLTNRIRLEKSDYSSITLYDGPLAVCMKQFENKNHSDVTGSSEMVQYKNAQSISNVVMHLAKSIIAGIEQDAAKSDSFSPNLLSDVFPANLPTRETKGRNEPRRKVGGGKSPYKDPATVELINENKGFRYSVRSNQNPPEKIVLKLNNAVPLGQKTGTIAHNILDFDLSRTDQTKLVQGCEARFSENEVTLSKISPDSDVSLQIIDCNFNQNKNLEIEIATLSKEKEGR